MGIWYNELKTKIHIDAVKHNWQLIQKKCKNPVPVIKSDAYGHGLAPISRMLAEYGARSMAVGTVSEAAALRLTPFAGEIISLLGPINSEDYQYIIDYSLLPFIGNFEQLRKLYDTGNGSPPPVALKFQTGMSRLGFDPDQAEQVAETVNRLPGIRPVYLCSHLAAADNPREDEYTRYQACKMLEIDAALRRSGIVCRKCLANSAGILGWPEMHLDAQRPGIALYGGNPFYGNEREQKGADLKQAMHVWAPVLEVRNIDKGQTISYGRTFKAPKKMRVAIVACGYADNYSRGLSNTGWMLLHEKRAPILGRVCMQLTAVDASAIPETQIGDKAHILGGPGPHSITAHELANWWKTISYEVFCLLGQNRKKYV